MVTTTSLDVTTSYAAEVVESKLLTDTRTLALTMRCKSPSSGQYGPLKFDSPTVCVSVSLDHHIDRDDATDDKSPEVSVCLAMQNSLALDQYKVVYGHRDMRWYGCQYYVRVKHSQCGDLMLGSTCVLNAGRYTFAGAVDTSTSSTNKRKGALHCLLLPERSSHVSSSQRRLIKIPLTKVVSTNGVELCAEDDIKVIQELLSAKIDTVQSQSLPTVACGVQPSSTAAQAAHRDGPGKTVNHCLECMHGNH